ncbi:MAG: Rpn family recombination-promoting nuclease/putative transposase [Muribaculaceae bacterium]|jgi:predicted transposase/invertase (TIGR01784 family)
MENDEKLIRFDWAIKRLLRHKADHSILEGFLTSLLGRPIHIIKLLESESNREYAENKLNRVDILAEEQNGAKLLIEVQNESEDAYFHRMLFGTSKLISEYLRRGDNYENVSKVYSINIVYFNLGEGTDYVYWGKTVFRGLHNNEILQLPERMKRKYSVCNISDLYPEYCILRVNDFDKWSNTPLDQWMYFLSTSTIPSEADAPGLREASIQLRVDNLSKEEKKAYYDHLDNMTSMRSIVDDAHDAGMWEGEIKGREIGRAEGRAEGIEEGRLEERIAIARNLAAAGMDPETIASITGLPVNKLTNLI